MIEPTSEQCKLWIIVLERQVEQLNKLVLIAKDHTMIPRTIQDTVDAVNDSAKKALERIGMGAYINPADQTKEAFLEQYGLQTTFAEFKEWENCPQGMLPVCLIDNGFFTAAGICYSDRELEVFSDLNDTRRKLFFYVETDKLLDVSNLKHYL